MSIGERIVIYALFLCCGIYLAAAFASQDNLEKRITVLEKQLKESQKAADYRFELCRKQLGHRSEQ